MKTPLLAATLFLSASAVYAQTSGVSRPPEADIESSSEATAAPVEKPAKPSASVPYQAPAPAGPTFKIVGPVARPSTIDGTDAGIVGDVPLRDQQAEARLRAQYPDNPDAGVVTRPIPRQTESAAPNTLKARPEHVIDTDIVTEVPHNEREFPMGTELKIRLANEISTTTTTVGTPFHGDLLEPISHNGQIVIPAGSEVRGHVTEVRGGRRIAGAALIHLEPRAIVLPDGSEYHLHAAVIDSDQFADTRVNSEGSIIRRDHAGATLAAMSLTTGGAAATGAIFGGGVGAVVGAGIGAGVSTVWWLKQDRQTHLPKDSTIVFNLTTPMSITPDQRSTGAPAEVAGKE